MNADASSFWTTQLITLAHPIFACLYGPGKTNFKGGKEK